MHNLWEAKVECLSLCAQAAMDHDDFYGNNYWDGNWLDMADKIDD